MAQLYRIKWNNYESNIISMCAKLRDAGAMMDVTLIAKGGHLQAHKLVLSACSTYFHKIFTNDPSDHPIVALKDIAISDLRAIVDYMYQGEVKITQEDLPQLLRTAKSLQIKGLYENDPPSSLTNLPNKSTAEVAGVPEEVPKEVPKEESIKPFGKGNEKVLSVALPVYSPISSGGSSPIMMIEETRQESQNIEVERGSVNLPMNELGENNDISQNAIQPLNLSLKADRTRTMPGVSAVKASATIDLEEDDIPFKRPKPKAAPTAKSSKPKTPRTRTRKTKPNSKYDEDYVPRGKLF